MQYILPAILIVLLAFLLRIGVRRMTILEYEKGLRYSKGRFDKVLASGQYWYLPWFSIIQKVDVRPRFVSIIGQEVLSSDGVTIKVSLAANYEIASPEVAINKVQSFQDALYLELQIALRQIIGAADIDTILNTRNELSKKLMEMTGEKIQKLGLNLISVSLKDIMFPGKLKETFAQVISAKKEGLAALEKARGESAALRNLANAAKMLDGNPNLMQLRLLQAIGQSSGNTLVLGMPDHSTAVPIKVQNSHEGKSTTPEKASE
jgi:regulator of protease activity HflC (stomatin/prohibitin superfamily)